MELPPISASMRRAPASFERTLIIAEEGAYVSIWKAAPRRSATRTSCMRRWSSSWRSMTPRSNIRPSRTGIRATRTARAASTTSSPSAAIAAVRVPRSLDAGGNRFGDHLEVPVLHPAGDESRGEFYSIAVSNGHQQIDSGTKMIHLGKNTSSRSSPRASPPAFRRHLSRTGLGAPQGDECAQLHSVRLAADRRPLRRPYGSLYRSEELDCPVRARGDHVEDLGRPAVLLPAARHSGRSGDRADRQRLRQGGHPGASDGVCGRSAEADRISLEGSVG